MPSNESLQWGTPESQPIRPKSRGSGIMISDFITKQWLFTTEQVLQENYWSTESQERGTGHPIDL